MRLGDRKGLGGLRLLAGGSVGLGGGRGREVSLLGAGRLLDDRGAGLLSRRRLGGLLNRSGGSAGLLGGGSIGVALLNGRAGGLLGSLLAHVALVHSGLLGTTHVLLGHGNVLRSSGGGGLESLVGVLSGNLAELRGLLVGELGGVVEVAVDQFLVLDVDQRSEVDDAGGEEQETPLGSDLDEEVADEGGEESLGCVRL